ncbi:polysaccharide biosynthesis protein [Alcaligenaceae bacterium]|nr:polysaccharide biosynthesis protein [Alcaligenaceae bacterium]
MRPTKLAKTVTFRERLLGLPRSQKRLLQIIADTCLIWLALWLAFFLRLDNVYAAQAFSGHAWLFIVAPVLTISVFAKLGLYRTVMRYVGYQALIMIAVAVTVSAVLLGIVILVYRDPTAIVPRSIPIIYWLLCLFFMISLRMVMRQYFRGMSFDLQGASFLPASQHDSGKVRVAIYGAGDAGNQLVMALRLGTERHPVAFIDDNLDLSGRVIAGLPVYGPNDLARLIKEKSAQEVLLAIPSATRTRRMAIVNLLTPYSFNVRTVPGFMDLASGRVKVQDLREVDISDLLGRDPVQPDSHLLERCIRNQVVMVTGAGGSIGAELCRQILHSKPRTLILFEQCEFNLYSIQSELESFLQYTDEPVQIVPVLSSVRNQERLFDVMSIWKVDTVYHAAAYKHVPMVERNVAEGVINNIFGTLYSAQAALKAGVANFVLISTDKAVRPTNIMGSTKRMAELVLQALSHEEAPCPYSESDEVEAVANRTRFTMVRFGNVLGSSGSVIPLFRKQIQTGGPITVTHPDITRYFMTIPEAAQLVIQAGSMGEGGDVFVLDMGQPVKITELAKKMILLSGLSVRSAQAPDGDIGIAFVGLRPGEKLYEELLIGSNVTPTEHLMILRANEKHINWEQLKLALADLASAVKNDDYSRIRELFLELVDGYNPDAEMVDWIHLQQAAAKILVNNAKHAMQRPQTEGIPAEA